MAIKVKFSKEEEERIRKYAESYGITPSEAVECAILKECQSPEDKEFYKKIEELKKKDSVSKAISFKDYLANSEAEDKAMKAGNLRSEKNTKKSDMMYWVYDQTTRELVREFRSQSTAHEWLQGLSGRYRAYSVSAKSKSNVGSNNMYFDSYWEDGKLITRQPSEAPPIGE